ncbi:MAG: agarase [Bacteroidota bacterium]
MRKYLSIQFFICAFCTGSTCFSQVDVSIWDRQNQVMLLDFETANSLRAVNEFNSVASITEDVGVTSGNGALRIVFKEDEEISGINLVPKSPWSTSEFKHFCLVFDATNLTDVSVQLMASVNSGSSGGISRSVAIPAGGRNTYYFELEGVGVGVDYGLRDDPAAFDTDAVRMIIKGRKQSVDYTQIASVRFFIQSNSKDKTIVLDNIRLVESPEMNPHYLRGIIDKYGQNNKMDFALKVHSDAELRKLADEELRALAVSKPMPDRGVYGGWKDGPKLEATGYFRTQKVGGKWALVDPEGYLFFSTGIANARMANSTTFTGIDYKDESVRYQDPEDTTPEDSKGMVALTDKVTSTAYQAYPERNNMFVGLPAYDDPLANHYSYRRQSHMGPIEHGETYSFYQANLERRYGESYPGSYLLKWRDVTIDRMLDWGFTSFGNWAAEDFYGSKRIPYFANGWIIGDFKTMSEGYWAPMPDPFDPEFVRRAKLSIQTVANQVKNSPWCIGVFIDNEKSWGREGSPESRYVIAIDALKHKAAELPTKAIFMKLLQEKYQNVEALSKAWNMEVSSWTGLAEGISVDGQTVYSDALLEDLAEMTVMYASEYFKVVHDALAKQLPNHLYMGVRFTSWGMTPEVREAATKYVDVFSYNFYRETIGVKFWEFLKDMDQPAIIGEYHFGALDAGLFHPGIIHAADQADRARMWEQYTGAVIDNPYFVGAHWFQYTDSPISGRAHDGENYNIGFVTGTDIPYPHMVKAAKRLNKSLYQRRFGDVKR